MKWSIQQLFKYNRKPFDFDVEMDLNEYIKSIEDIIAISPVRVKGNGKNIQGDRYLFQFDIEVVLTLEDACTLEEIQYPVELAVEEVYDVSNFGDEDIRLIEKNTIDLTEAVWENILLAKPMRVTKDDLSDELK